MSDLDIAGLAERQTLGGILRWPAQLDEIAAFLEPRHFGQPQNQDIFRLMLKLWNERKPISIAQLLLETPEAKDVHRASLRALYDDEATGAMAVLAARKVHAASLQRALVYAANEILLLAGEHFGEVEPLLERAEQLILAVGQDREAEDVLVADRIPAVYDALDSRKTKNRAPGVLSGFEALDEMICGFPEGGLILVAARPSVGKTAFAANLVVNAAKTGMAVYFVSLEQDVPELIERMLCSEGRVNSYKAKMGWLNDEEVRCIMEAGDVLSKCRLYVNDKPNQSLMKVSALARRQKRKNNIGMLVVDYLQLIEAGDKRKQRHEQVSSISRDLKCLARELQIPVICLAQLNRDSEKRKGGEPILADLRESGSLEQDADIVLLLHRPDKDEGGDDSQAKVIVAKHRNGRTGKVTLQFTKASMRFDTIPGLGGQS